jgi:hypothetical protein
MICFIGAFPLDRPDRAVKTIFSALTLWPYGWRKHAPADRFIQYGFAPVRRFSMVTLM